VGLLGLAWRAAPAALDEASYLLADPFVSALNVALAKVRAVAASADEMVVAADTLVVVDDEILGKPDDAATARGMLRRLRSRPHHVLSGVVLRGADEGQQWGAVISTRVLMRHYADREIDDYVGRGEPFDKAGGYAIQDAVFRPVENLEGCYLNVVGLPLCAVAAGLQALGVQLNAEGESVPPCGYCRLGADVVAVRSG